MKVRWLLLAALAAAGVALGSAAQAQQGGDNPPEILTSELALKTVLESDRLEVNFVIVDADKVTEVTIDGQPQTFEAADTVMITRSFVFRQPVTRVRVSAKDEAGNSRTVVYTVFLPGVDPNQAQAATAPAEGRFFGRYDVRVESDSNPSNELSLPVSVGDFEVRGGTDDTRMSISGYGAYTKGNLTGLAGGTKTEYSNEANNAFEAQVIYLGGILAMPRGEAAAIELSYLFADVNVNNDAYAQLHTVGGGYRTASAADDGGTESTVWAGELVRKMFAAPPGDAPKDQEDATLLVLKWNLTATDKDKLDTYRRRAALGTDSEGLEETKYTFLSGDWDWENRWDRGLLFDIGVGIAYRDYPNDVASDPDIGLGANRVDIPMRFSTGVGWQFSPQVRLMGNYEYKFNFSNKVPYVRQIVGVSVNGTF